MIADAGLAGELRGDLRRWFWCRNLEASTAANGIRRRQARTEKAELSAWTPPRRGRKVKALDESRTDDGSALRVGTYTAAVSRGLIAPVEKVPFRECLAELTGGARTAALREGRIATRDGGAPGLRRRVQHLPLGGRVLDLAAARSPAERDAIAVAARDREDECARVPRVGGDHVQVGRARVPLQEDLQQRRAARRPLEQHLLHGLIRRGARVLEPRRGGCPSRRTQIIALVGGRRAVADDSERRAVHRRIPGQRRDVRCRLLAETDDAAVRFVPGWVLHEEFLAENLLVGSADEAACQEKCSEDDAPANGLRHGIPPMCAGYTLQPA